ncbi:hypothetical protein P4S72_28470 [Vibrio sp. PP-XX7]
MKIKHSLGLLSLTLLSQYTFSAMPYHEHAYQYTQPNGEVITLTLNGNDYFAEQRTNSGISSFSIKRSKGWLMPKFLPMGAT